MKPRKTKDIRSVLESKGFIPANRDHVYLFLHVAGRKTSIRTKLSHGVREYGSSLLMLMSKQLKLTNPELEDLLDCPMDYNKYVSLLRQKGELN